MEAIGGIDNNNNNNNNNSLSDKEISQLQKLSKLDNSQLKDKIGEEHLSSFKSLLEGEKKSYLNRSSNDVSKKWVGSMFNKIINNISVVSTEQKVVSTEQKVVPTEQGLTINESNEKLESTIWEYFDIPSAEGEALKSKLDQYGLNLNIVPFLTTYKKHIEDNLVGNLDTSILKNITDSIGIRVLHLSKIIDERITFVEEQIDEGDYKVDKSKPGYETKADVKATEIKNERWIINSKLQESFSFVDNELLPSATLLIKHNKGENINWSHFDGNKKLEEITEMFDTKLDEDGNFDEGFFSTQNTVDASDDLYKDLMNQNGINVIEGALLLDKNDKKIEANAMKWFMIAIAGQFAIEVGPAVAASVIPVAGTVFGGLAGAAVGGTIDIADVFSDTEVLLDMVQSAGLVDPSFRMEKTWIDNAIAAIGILPLATVVIKGGKLTEFLSKIPTDELTSGMDKMKDIFKAKISGESVPKIKNIDIKNNNIIDGIDYSKFNNLKTREDINLKIVELNSTIDRNLNMAGTPSMISNRKIDNALIEKEIIFLENKLIGLNIYTDTLGNINKILESISDISLKNLTFNKLS